MTGIVAEFVDREKRHKNSRLTMKLDEA